jgi:hypothetical protein
MGEQRGPLSWIGRIARRLGAGLLALLLALVLAAPADAGALEDGLEAHGRGDYATAAALLHQAAEQGHAEAQLLLGGMYFEGWGVPRDYSQAAAWWRKAAEQGLAQAQHNLGVMYKRGQGVPQDDAQAVAWFGKAAEQGDEYSQLNLGFMYEGGLGVPQDYVAAHMWYNIAAARFSASEAYLREDAVQKRNNVAKLMTPAQIAEAQKRARDWQPKQP